MEPSRRAAVQVPQPFHQRCLLVVVRRPKLQMRKSFRQITQLPTSRFPSTLTSRKPSHRNIAEAQTLKTKMDVQQTSPKKGIMSLSFSKLTEDSLFNWVDTMSNTTSNSGSEILHNIFWIYFRKTPRKHLSHWTNRSRMRATWLKSFKGRIKSSLLSSLSQSQCRDRDWYNALH